ncbi:Rad52/Rad22 family DNA repair protein [Nocardiopsis sp. YSL2]|uniref:Rad52/Rad22 family DNA repair protein n=1 Tax=Nocardiopsis sp. YSL2 TaxID=2939492 RepID=UPI0026F435D8|nr:Rad52/Rad22 family DNA repair protein [Nocardiopsis sp. YSL2]
MKRPASGSQAGPEATVAHASGPATPHVEAGPADLTPEQVKTLLTGIQSDRVQRHRNNSHLEGWDVRRTLTRIFGFGGWSDQTLELTCIREHADRIDGDIRWWVVYRAQVRLIIRTTDGRVLSWWDDTAVGDASKQVTAGQAHDLASKSAVTQALKRCAANLGDQLGLSLYRKGDLSPVVIWSAAHIYPESQERMGEVGPGATDPEGEFAATIRGRIAGATTPEQLNQIWSAVTEEQEQGLSGDIAEGLHDALHARFAEMTEKPEPEQIAAAQDAEAEAPQNTTTSRRGGRRA